MQRELSRAGEHAVAIAIALLALFLITLLARAAQQASPARQETESGPLRISVDVALVVLHATVTDRQGGVVSDLGRQDFEIHENGVPQRIQLFKNEDIPVTVGLIVDHSTTMERKLPEVTAAAQAFARSSNREDEMFVVNFNEKVSLGLSPTTRFTNSADEIERAIAAKPTLGQTALYDAIAKGLEELRAGSRDKKVLIVVSDGGDNVSSHSLGEVMKLAERSSAIIYTVGIFDEGDPDRNPGVLRRLAQATGGEAFFPDELGEVASICGRIARDIRHQYTIGYVPGNPARDGVYRAIQVQARANSHGRLSVRTRAGYRAGGEPRLDENVAK